MKQIIQDGGRPIKIWTNEIEDAALTQAKNLSRLPFIHSKGVALMPDVHAGIGATVGSVIATKDVVIPAAVGVDIGCGMNAVRTSLKADDLPDSLSRIRSGIEWSIPLGKGGMHAGYGVEEAEMFRLGGGFAGLVDLPELGNVDATLKKAMSQLGTLGSGNHFIEICLDENDDVWVMLHSGSRGIGNRIGTHFIDLARREMERWHISLPDKDLAYLPEGSVYYTKYLQAVGWAQSYALKNREVMMRRVLDVLKYWIPTPFTVTDEAINCHHNYVTRENHFGQNLWITRKGAIRAAEGSLGIIPGSMGARSYIVRGKGNPESYCSCSRGAGRAMSRTQARRTFTLNDLASQTLGVECRKDDAVLDEIPGAYKDIDTVMENQRDLVDVIHTLKQVLCVKGA